MSVINQLDTSILDKVKLSLRIKGTTVYDNELEIYINTCLYDLKRVGIFINPMSLDDEIQTAVICYVKSKFGNTDLTYKEAMYRAYQDIRLALAMDSKRGL